MVLCITPSVKSYTKISHILYLGLYNVVITGTRCRGLELTSFFCGRAHPCLQ